MASRIRKPPDSADGPLWEHAAGIAMHLADEGYARNTIHSQLWLVARLSRWMAKEGLALAVPVEAANEKPEELVSGTKGEDVAVTESNLELLA